MATIPNTQKFHTVADAIDTTEYGSAQLAAGRTVFTMQDILDTVVVGGGVDGSGTAGVIPLWSDSNTIGDSIISATASAATITGDVTANSFAVDALGAEPASASAAGTLGEIRYALDTGVHYIYLCIATDTWQRVALATWA